MVLQACDEAGVPGDFAVPAALDGVVVECVGVGELVFELGQEVGAGLVVVAVLADVGVGAGVGGEVAGAVAVRDAGLIISLLSQATRSGTTGRPATTRGSGRWWRILVMAVS